VRSLAADLGTALGGGAHLSSLRRTAVGGFGLDDAGTVEAPVLRPVADAVRHLGSLVVDDTTALAVGHGKVLDRDRLGVETGEGPWAVLDAAGELLAVYEPYDGDRTKPMLVLAR
jgi:tRNA pseudouridine55 synthase